MSDLQKATALLKDRITCAAVRGESVYTSTATGISPMLDFLNNGVDLRGFSVADKIVGKAAALLFIKAEIRSVYAEVLSIPAQEILERYRIPVRFETLTDRIINRAGTDSCPMEKAVAPIDDPETAFSVLWNTRKQLQKK